MNPEILKPLVEEGWYKQLKPFFESVEFDKIISSLKDIKAKGKSVVPIDTEFLNAFKYCKYDDLKVVILGMDPYQQLHNGQPVACGLAFGSGVRGFVPPSLRNIIQEVENDIDDGLNLRTFLGVKQDEANLKQWAEQGVLLLNTALTTEVGVTGAHLELWKPFTNYVLSLLSVRNNGLIYMLWGEKAQMYLNFINQHTNFVLIAGHPSPLNTSETKKFKGCKHFSKANEIIEANNGKEFTINW